MAERGARAHIARMKAAAGVSVTYRRGAECVTLTAWLGRTGFSRSAPSPGGASLVWGDRDYFVAVADLVLGGETVTPREGDRIIEMIGGVEVTFEVEPTATGEPAWRYSDPTRLVWRIHVKEQAE